MDKKLIAMRCDEMWK